MAGVQRAGGGRVDADVERAVKIRFDGAAAILPPSAGAVLPNVRPPAGSELARDRWPLIASMLASHVRAFRSASELAAYHRHTAAQSALNTTAAFWPPKPRLLLMTTFTLASRATFGT